MSDRLARMFDEAGLPHAERLEKVPNSRGALILAELARDRGVLARIHPRLFDAYWARGLDIGDEQVLVEEGSAVGLDRGDVVDALVNPDYLERVSARTREALELGIGGVPGWVIDERLLVPGAQPHEVFARVLERLGYEPSNSA
jgi:predicted DsbA family dithiol-disulfide isomerase